MRKFINGAGIDSTTAVLSWLASHRTLYIADLYVIRTAPSYAGQFLDKTFLVTNYPTPLLWNFKGTFLPASAVSRDGVESKIGLESTTLAVEWSPSQSDLLCSSPLLTALQGFRYGIFDNGDLEVWRCLMPTVGDCNTFGACNMFTGRIGDLDFDRNNVKLSVINRLETLNQQIPTNLIESINIYAQYNVGQVPAGVPTSFAIAAGTTVSKIFCTPAMTSDGTFSTGYLTIKSGNLAGTYRRIRQQTLESGDTVFYLNFPLPFLPAINDTLSAYTTLPLDLATCNALGIPFAGFPYIVNPIDSSVLV